MKSYPLFFIFIASAMALILIGCPSPTGLSVDGGSDSTASSARVVESGDGLVFIEEDGSETPIVAEVDGETDGPVELIDYAVLDGGGEGRSTGSGTSPRCIIVGRRRDGGSGVWAYYRGLGVFVVPFEDGTGDSALLELTEGLPVPEGNDWFTGGWICEATAISDDGKVILGNLSRPDGWEYLEDEDVPDPEIGIWWNIYRTDEFLVISLPRPIILMEEPEETVVSGRCVKPDPWQWLEELKKLVEKLLAVVMDQAWNYLASTDDFVDSETLEALGITVDDGLYPVAGVDKYGADAWAWITASSVENIEDARVADDPNENLPPYPVTGPTLWQGVTYNPDDPEWGSPSFFLEIEDNNGDPVEYPYFDPDYTPENHPDQLVGFTATAMRAEPFDDAYPTYEYDPDYQHGVDPPLDLYPEAEIDETGEFRLKWDPLYNETPYQIWFMITADDGIDSVDMEQWIKVQAY